MNAFAERMKQGKEAVGTFCQVAAPAVVEMAGYAGFDFVIIDLEHGPFGIETAEAMVRAAEVAGTVPVVRVRENNASQIGQALDIGAKGVVVPQIASGEDARRAVQAARYHPRGARGACPLVRSAQYTKLAWGPYAARANEDTTVMLLIEGAEGIAKLPEILAVEGIDVLFIGPFDLSQSVGVPGEMDHPLVMAKADEVIAAAKAKGVEVATFCTDIDKVAGWRARGVRCIAFSADIKLIFDSFRASVAALKG